ncbi:hypothetical protein KY285_000541 [Solanum tuberosum]|nr:hypothetical protein KY285_000541 [Solanum tuberosum]
MGYYVDAPVDWCCEEFDIGKGIMFSSSGLEIVHYEGPRLPTSEKICQSTVQPKKHSKFPGGHHINWEKEVRTGKMRYLHVEEALGLSSSIKKYGSPRINTVISRVLSTKSMATVARGIIGKPRAQISNSFREKSKLQPPLGSTEDWCCEECDIGKWIIFSSSGLENVHYEGPRLPASKKICQSTMQPKKHKAFGLSSNINNYESPWINTVSSRFVSTKSMATVARGIFSKPRAQISNLFGSFDILGSFEFVPGMLNSCIQAHPSFRARRKVYEFSSLLPDTLKFELDRRGNIWESLFNNHILGKEDIGLYFFASEKERKSTDVRLATIAVGTANHGGLAKLSIQENNICRGVTDICLKDIARGCHLN